MIHEFAVDPELLEYWCQERPFRFWRSQFGVGQQRMATAHPSRAKWKKLARSVVQRLAAAPEVQGTKAAANLEWLFRSMTEVAIDRQQGQYDGNLRWLENALLANSHQPFQGILTHRDDRAEPCLIDARDFPPDGAAWDVEAAGPVARSADAIVARLDPMLRASRHLILVDPHVDFTAPRYTNTLAALLRRFFDGRDVTTLEACIVVGDGRSRAETERLSRARTRGQAWHDAALPGGASVQVEMVAQRAQGEKVHDRFVLTELGGVQFSVGLDEGDPGETDTAQLLNRPTYDHAWRVYSAAASSFDVQGTWRLP